MVLLSQYVNKRVQIMTNDSRIVLGKLVGFDQKINVVLEDSSERLYSHDQPADLEPLGTALLRGDNIAVIGLVDEAREAQIDYAQQTCGPPNPVSHSH